jgi:hypothetical protein
MKQYYKFLNLNKRKITSKHGNHVWKIGQEYSVKGKIVKCENGFHASEEPLDALGYVNGDVLALVEGSGDSDSDTDKICFRTMKIVKAYKWTALDSVALAIYAAEQVIKIYEDKYPNDSRPRDAIKAAKAYLKTPNKKTADATARAADAAYAAADAAYAAARAAYATDAADAARAAYAAARAAYATDAADAARAARAAYAAYAADAARAAYAAYAAAYATRAAADAAYAADAARAAADAAYATDAARAAYAELKAKINRYMKSHIKKLEEIQ